MDASAQEEELLVPRKKQDVPQDRFHIVYIIFSLMGLGTLLPWNFYSNAKQYFMYKLRNLTLNGSEAYTDTHQFTQLQFMFESYLTLAAMLPNLLFMFLNTALTKHLAVRVRVITASVFMILMFFVTLILTKINTDDWQHLFFIVSMVSVIIMNASSAVLQGGLFGLAGMFPKRYTQAIMGGMAMGGTMAAVANIFSITIGSDPLESGFGYFLTALLGCIAALISYLMLSFSKFARYHTELKSVVPPPDDAVSSVSDHQVVRGQGTAMLQVFKKVWVYAFSVFFIFSVSLSCYPVINSAIVSESATYRGKAGNLWGDKYFVPVSCFLLFNLGDLVGRSLAGIFQSPQRGSFWLPLFSILRMFAIPVFLLCNVRPRHNLPVVFTYDWIPIIIMVLFAFSNGYLSTLAMMYGPVGVIGDNVEMAGAMMSFFLSLGLAVGSLLAMLLVNIV